MKPAGRRRKGVAGEREVAALLNGATIRGRTLTARRVPNTGAMAGGGWGGDVLMGEKCSSCYLGEISGSCETCLGSGVSPGTEERVEVKRRANGEGFATINRWIADSHMLVMRGDRGEWLVVMRLRDFIEGKP